MKKNNPQFNALVDELSDFTNESYLFHLPAEQTSLPSTVELEKIIIYLREILFPGYFGESNLGTGEFKSGIERNLLRIRNLLSEQIHRGFCFFCKDTSLDCERCSERSVQLAGKFIEKLPQIRHSLSTDAMAAYTGDPAAKHISETILCYPSLVALTHHRVAHELVKLDIPLIPRMIAEMSHANTGIDIHPGAEIGESFFIDHGTGVVIGETAVIGNNVRIYQGVTLGAKSFPLDENGKPVKGIPRHPVIADDVIIYANSTILGRIHIGKGAVIGGNLWVSNDVPDGAVMTQSSVMGRN